MGLKRSSLTITVIFLLVGLIAGAVGGYFFSLSSYRNKIREKEDQIEDLTSDISTLNSTLLTLDSENVVQKSKISELESKLDGADETILILEGKISTQEGQISDLKSRLISFQSIVGELTSQLIPKPGYEKFSAHGFSFDYPKEMYLSFSGRLESTANLHSGLVTASMANEKEKIVIAWIDETYPRDINNVIEDGFISMSTLGSIIRGDRVTSTIRGHELIYQDFYLISDGKTHSGVLGGFNCDENKIVYSISYMYEGEEYIVPKFLEYLDSLFCHR